MKVLRHAGKPPFFANLPQATPPGNDWFGLAGSFGTPAVPWREGGRRERGERARIEGGTLVLMQHVLAKKTPAAEVLFKELQTLGKESDLFPSLATAYSLMGMNTLSITQKSRDNAMKLLVAMRDMGDSKRVLELRQATIKAFRSMAEKSAPPAFFHCLLEECDMLPKNKETETLKAELWALSQKKGTQEKKTAAKK